MFGFALAFFVCRFYGYRAKPPSSAQIGPCHGGSLGCHAVSDPLGTPSRAIGVDGVTMFPSSWHNPKNVQYLIENWTKLTVLS